MPAALSSGLLASERLYEVQSRFGGLVDDDGPQKPTPARSGLGGMGPRAASAAGCLDGMVSFGFDSDVLPNTRPKRSSSTPWGLSTIRDGCDPSQDEEGGKSDSDDDTPEFTGSPPTVRRRRAQS